MTEPKKGKLASFEYFWETLLFGIPLLALFMTALLNWTVRVCLEPNLLMRLLKLVGLPFYILLIIIAPPLLVAWCASYLFRRSDTVFGVVLIVLMLAWGFWYLVPPIIDNWEEFLRFVDEFGAV